MTKVVIVACVVALALAVVFAGSAGNAATPEGAVFTASITDIDEAVGGSRVTTVFQIRDRKASVVGWGTTVCLALQNGAFQCWGSYVLPKGKISVQGTRRNRSFYVLAIVGGTGRYNGWGGTLIGRQYAPDRERLVFEGLAP